MARENSAPAPAVPESPSTTSWCVSTRSVCSGGGEAQNRRRSKAAGVGYEASGANAFLVQLW